MTNCTRAVALSAVLSFAAALARIVRGEVPGGPALAKLAANQIEEQYDWALTTDLRPVDYASRHFDEPGAREAAKEILASRPGADPQCHSN